MLKLFKRFKNDESGAVTVDWVVLTAAIVALGGVAYPLVKMEVSSYSHPFYTGKQKLLDTAGRVDKFRNRYAKFSK